jgi:hypothetical protein
LRPEFKGDVGKPLPLYPGPDVGKVQAELAREFPHATREVSILLSDLTARDAVRFRPTLIVGSAGCGKSRLARRLGEAVGVHVASYDAAGSSDSTFSGAPRRWTSGEPSFPLMVVKAVLRANPLLLIDEVDKGSVGRQNGRLFDALLPFLDVETSKRMADPYLQETCDLSHVSYILTANSLDPLPKPLHCRILRCRRSTRSTSPCWSQRSLPIWPPNAGSTPDG